MTLTSGKYVYWANPPHNGPGSAQVWYIRIFVNLILENIDIFIRRIIQKNSKKRE
jgi:hypothetical protein